MIAMYNHCNVQSLKYKIIAMYNRCNVLWLQCTIIAMYNGCNAQPFQCTIKSIIAMCDMIDPLPTLLNCNQTVFIYYWPKFN